MTNSQIILVVCAIVIPQIELIRNFLVSTDDYYMSKFDRILDQIHDILSVIGVIQLIFIGALILAGVVRHLWFFLGLQP